MIVVLLGFLLPLSVFQVSYYSSISKGDPNIESKKRRPKKGACEEHVICADSFKTQKIDVTIMDYTA